MQQRYASCDCISKHIACILREEQQKPELGHLGSCCSCGRQKMAGEEDWRKTADTHKMSPEGVKAAGVESSKRPPGHNPGGVLHQRRGLPYSYTTIAIAGLLISGAVMYTAIYVKKKPEATAMDVAKATTGVGKPEDTHPRK